ncbi:hypothetical protein MPL3356_60559 [Mesorhizobium plurifarium]|uniref:Uncharacterized protein n=1 Tax=Mesorhizobium plurifarium TaxID=69974 RepID=A0A090EFA4_MESPL|nr:hypothetical protein MPL3356_60559 [Mesorhizobium plurifarium]
MGDRCYLELRLRGRIETVEAFEKIVALFEENNWQVAEYDAAGRTLEMTESLVVGDANGEAPTFYLNECNYADIGEEEAELQEIGIAYEVSHEEGGDYGAGAWSWSSARGKVEAGRIKNQGASVSIAALEAALKQPDPLAAVKAIVDAGNAAEGTDLPGYSLSDEVKAWLAKEGN